MPRKFDVPSHASDLLDRFDEDVIRDNGQKATDHYNRRIQQLREEQAGPGRPFVESAYTQAIEIAAYAADAEKFDITPA